MKVLVTFAVDAEFAPWRRLRPFHRTLLGSAPVYESCIGGAEVSAVCTGIGPGQAARLMPRLLAEPPAVCISSGLAGGLRHEYRPGTVLAARAVRRLDAPGFEKSDAALLRQAGTAGARVVDTFLTSESVILTAEQKSRLGALADAVEMESFEILKAMSALRIPAVAVRAVSDPADADLPLDFNRIVGAEGRVSFPRLTGQIAARPHRIPALIRLGRESRRAAASLAEFLDAFVSTLAMRAGQELRFAEAAAG